jgi:hypothetical protein
MSQAAQWLRAKWISVEDQLPEPEIDVLVWFEVGQSNFAIANYDGDEEWNDANTGYVFDAWPRFWMTLPRDPVEVATVVAQT